MSSLLFLALIMIICVVITSIIIKQEAFVDRSNAYEWKNGLSRGLIFAPTNRDRVAICQIETLYDLQRNIPIDEMRPNVPYAILDHTSNKYYAVTFTDPGCKADAVAFGVLTIVDSRNALVPVFYTSSLNGVKYLSVKYYDGFNAKQSYIMYSGTKFSLVDGYTGSRDPGLLRLEGSSIMYNNVTLSARVRVSQCAESPAPSPASAPAPAYECPPLIPCDTPGSRPAPPPPSGSSRPGPSPQPPQPPPPASRPGVSQPNIGNLIQIKTMNIMPDQFNDVLVPAVQSNGYNAQFTLMVSNEHIQAISPVAERVYFTKSWYTYGSVAFYTEFANRTNANIDLVYVYVKDRASKYYISISPDDNGIPADGNNFIVLTSTPVSSWQLWLVNGQMLIKQHMSDRFIGYASQDGGMYMTINTQASLGTNILYAKSVYKVMTYPTAAWPAMLSYNRQQDTLAQLDQVSMFALLGVPYALKNVVPEWNDASVLANTAPINIIGNNDSIVRINMPEKGTAFYKINPYENKPELCYLAVQNAQNVGGALAYITAIPEGDRSILNVTLTSRPPDQAASLWNIIASETWGKYYINLVTLEPNLTINPQQTVEQVGTLYMSDVNGAGNYTGDYYLKVRPIAGNNAVVDDREICNKFAARAVINM